MTTRRSLVLATLILIPGLAAAATTGTGVFRLDKTKSTFTSACAYRVANPEAPGSTQVAVVLASKPLDCAAFNAGFTPVEDAEKAIESQKGAIAVLTLSPGGDSVNGSWHSWEPFDTFGFGGQGELKLTKNTATRVEGRHSTKEPSAFFDKTFEFDFKFAADVLDGAVAGTALPKGGGEPGAAYQAYLKALAKNDKLASAKKLVLPEYASTLEWTHEMEFKDATISGGLMKGNRAALDVSGKSFDGDKTQGRVYLLNEGGTWKVADKAVRVVFE